MTCHSGGTLEIYVEPHLPAPLLWVAGTTPIAGALATLGAAGRLAGHGLRPDRRRRRRSRPPSASSPGPTLRRARSRRSPVRRRRDPGRSGTRRRSRPALAPRRVVRRASSPRRPGPPSSAQWLREETAVGRGAARRAARAGRPRPRRRDGRGDRPLDPRRARPGPARAGRLRGRRRARRRWPGCRPARRIAPIAPVVDDIVLLDPVCGMTVDRAHARHLAEHDGRRLRVLLDRLPDALHPGAGGLRRRVGIIEPTDARPPPSPWRPACSSRAPSTIAAPRDKVWAFVIDPNQVGQCGPGVETIEVIDATHFKATAKVGIGFISARFVVNMEFAEQDAAGPGADQGPRPGARAAPSTRPPRCASRTARTATTSWTGRPTSTSPARSPASARG